MNKTNYLIALILGTSLFHSSTSIAQVDFNYHNKKASPLDLLDKKTPPKKEYKSRLGEPQEKYTEENIKELDLLLQEQNYIKFYDLFESLNVPNSEQINYLSSQQYKGHVPLYWLMADYYAKVNNVEKTHKWLYIATIMTQQDASLCTDKSSAGASRRLIRSFPLAAELTRKTPEYIFPVMKEVIFFVENIKERSHPIWVCNFGEIDLPEDTKVVMEKEAWETYRNHTLKKYIEKFNR